MPDQTPEVCACGHDRWSHGNDLLCAGCPPHERHPFRPAEPTPAERSDEWTVEGEHVFPPYGGGEVHRFWIRGAGKHVNDRRNVPLSLERAISSAAVAEARAEWEEGHDMHCLWADDHARAEVAERALEEARRGAPPE